MRPARTIALLLLLCPMVASAKNKKPEVPAIFGTATYVYVESADGDEMRPGLYPADRQAIADVEGALRDWKRYAVTAERSRAELIFVVRKGRTANGRVGANAPLGTPLPPNQIPGRPPVGGGPGVDASAEVGPDEDMLRVYLLNGDGKLAGPIWNRSQPDGLDEPQLPLFRQLKDAVERAYPPNAAAKP